MTEAASPRLRVLMVGAGRRVKNNFLPVLRCLSDQFEVVGVHARTAANLLPVAERWNVPAVHHLNDVDWTKVDVVAISVPTAQNAAVMRQLLPHASRLRLVLDTPIAWNLKELSECGPLMRQFRQVLVAEDYMNFPAFTLLRKFVADGLVGTPKAVTMYNIGYYYHGLALIRSFAQFAPVWRSSRQKAGSFTGNILYCLKGGFRACVIGPYRQHCNGGIMLEGDKGIITEVAADADFGKANGRPVHHLAKTLDNGLFCGYTLTDASGNVLHTLDLAHVRRMRDMPFDDMSDLNLSRGCGLIEVFRALLDDSNINNRYGLEHALYDSFVSRLATRGLLPVDLLVLAGRNVMLPLQFLAKLKNRG